jgi:hypothetical protein
MGNNKLGNSEIRETVSKFLEKQTVLLLSWERGELKTTT